MFNRNTVTHKNLVALVFSILFGLATILTSGTSYTDFSSYQHEQPAVKVADGGAITLPPLPNHGG